MVSSLHTDLPGRCSGAAPAGPPLTCRASSCFTIKYAVYLKTSVSFRAAVRLLLQFGHHVGHHGCRPLLACEPVPARQMHCGYCGENQTRLSQQVHLAAAVPTLHVQS
jgi:hypothetical protein